MADSSSQNSDSSNSSSQHVQNSQLYQMSYPQYHQQQLPFNYQMPQPYQMPYPQYPQQFPYNSSGAANFPLHFQYNSGRSNFPQQFQGSLSGGLIFPQQVSVDHHTGSSIPQHSSQIPVDLGDDDDDVEEAPAPTPNTKDAKAIWTPDEDIKLVNSWYNVCTDSIIGNQQKKKEFWMKITDFYNQYRPKDTIARSYSQVKNHYYKFNPDLTKWAGIYNNFWSN